MIGLKAASSRVTFRSTSEDDCGEWFSRSGGMFGLGRKG